jgi:hypothetical protein
MEFVLWLLLTAYLVMDMGTDILDKAAQSQSQEEVQVKGD